MNRLHSIIAWLLRGLSLVVLVLVLYFPLHKDLIIAYGPLLIALGAALAVHRRLEKGWNPLGTLGRPSYFALLILAPALVQLGLLLLLRPVPTSDGQFVFEEAAAFLSTGQMNALTYYPPAQTWWYWPWMKLFDATPLVAQISHIPLHAAVSLLTYGLARSVVPLYARIAGLAVAWYPSFIAYILTTPYYHYFYTACVVATAWGWIQSLKCSRASFGAGLASGLGALTKATQLIAVGQSLLFWALTPNREGGAPIRFGKRLVLFIAFALGMTLVVAPWTVRNSKVFGEPVLVCTSGGMVFHSANNETSNGLYSGLPDEAKVDSPQAMLEHGRASAEQAKAFIRENPIKFLALAWNKVLHTWGGESTFVELINIRGRPLPGWLDDSISAVFFFGWAFIVGLWAAHSLAANRLKLPLSAIELATAIVLGSNFLVYAIFEGGDRHHLPFVPLIVVVALANLPAVRQSSAADASKLAS